MGQIVRADEKLFGQPFQREFLGEVVVDVTGHRIHLLGDGIAEFLGFVAVVRGMAGDDAEEFQEIGVDGQPGQRGQRLLAQLEDPVQVAECLGPHLAVKPVDRHVGVKGGQRLPDHLAQFVRLDGELEVDDEPAVAIHIVGRVLGLVQQRGAQHHDVAGLRGSRKTGGNAGSSC